MSSENICDICGCVIDDEERSCTVYGFDECENAYSNEIQCCSDCYLMVSNESSELSSDYKTEIQDYVCPHQRNEWIIQRHLWRPRQFMKYKTCSDVDSKGIPLYLGFELEAGGLPSERKSNLTARSIIINQNAKMGEKFFIKRDGSIPSYGFELVSSPMTFDYHIKNSGHWQEIIEKMLECGMKSHDLGTTSCGLHIHVSKDFLNQNQWAIIDWFVGRNKKEFEILSRRPENIWAGYSDFYDCISEYSLYRNNRINRQKCIFKKYYGKNQYSHYRAVNFSNKDTVEFRMFRGSLKFETVMATLGIVDCLVRFAKEITPGMIARNYVRNKDTAFNLFMDYMKKHNERYGQYTIPYCTKNLSNEIDFNVLCELNCSLEHTA